MWEKRDKEIACKMKKSAGYKRTARKNERGMLKTSEIKTRDEKPDRKAGGNPSDVSGEGKKVSDRK